MPRKPARPPSKATDATTSNLGPSTPDTHSLAQLMDLTIPKPTTHQAPTAPAPPPKAPPQDLTFPHGTQESVAIAPSRMPSASQGLYRIRPHPDAAHLFAKKGQFICTYATQKHQITAQLARTCRARTQPTDTTVKPYTLTLPTPHIMANI